MPRSPRPFFAFQFPPSRNVMTFLRSRDRSLHAITEKDLHNDVAAVDASSVGSSAGSSRASQH